jgi:isocitrate/isopropylmalate dehydrogenase
MLLNWLSRKHSLANFAQAAAAMEKAVDALLTDPATRTTDLAGRLGTKAFTNALCGRINRDLSVGRNLRRGSAV